ncbi:TRAP-type C4-dicarboxylate transport system permease small subunit [Stella humosa]|uniref:TRAP transporter small permease protein n=1 Tax=Stella humosa TaxID=94 RepID=A0A3N1KRE5_9PROT|nr:TRAP transporter small permease [Stella humosa]ROP84453.1 TRAP-type C4-dicarboxylate transport system permease small subunit [Stella humosa]BBK33971.1 hypothetical protein STHU_46050 [Stella humosa]
MTGAPVEGAGIRLLDGLCRMLGVLSGVVLVAASAMTGVSVLGRYFLSWPIPGDSEIAGLALAVAISLAMPWCAWRRGHVVVDVATTRLPRRGRVALDMAGGLLLAGVAMLLAWRMGVGGVEMRAFGDESMVLRLPTWIGFALAVPCFVVTAVAALVAALRMAGGTPE